MGAWLNQTNMSSVVPIANAWFIKVHELRLDSDLAHASHSKGAKKQMHTKPVARSVAERALAGGRAAWGDLREWAKYLLMIFDGPETHS